MSTTSPPLLLQRDTTLLPLLIIPILAATALLTTPYYWAAPLLPIGLLGGLLLLRRPEFAFYLIIFLIPFGAYRQLGGAVKIDWILAGTALIAVAAQAVVTRQLRPTVRQKFWVAWFALFACYLLSTLYSPFKETAQHNIVLLAVGTLFLFLAMSLIGFKGYVKHLPNVVIFSVSAGSLLAVIGFAFGIELFADGGGFTRGTGVSKDPNNMALMVIFTAPLLVDRIVHVKRFRIMYVLMFFINTGALISTYSRSGLLVYLLTLTMIAWHFRRLIQPQHIGLALAGVFMTGLLAAVTVPTSYWERQLSVVKGQDFAMQRRTSYLEVGKEAFLLSPVIGHGPGTFRDIYGESATGAHFSRKGKTRRRFAHNSYIELLVGTGIVGFGVFISILATAWFSFQKARKRWAAQGRERLADLTRAWQLSLASVMIYLALFSEPLHKYLLLALAVSQVALALSQRKRKFR